jgi:hypothetical protein
MTTCRCEELPLLADVGMGEDGGILGTLERELRHGEPLWWLAAERCRACGQWWLVAADERINDVFIMRRLADGEIETLRTNGKWPPDFLKFAEVLRIGRERGHSVLFGDPESPALVDTVVDLAREERGISVSRIAWLLQIERCHAQRLAELAEARTSVSITRA